MKDNQRVYLDFNAMPSYRQDAMCRILLSCAKKYFEDPAVKKDFERWKKERLKRGKA